MEASGNTMNDIVVFHPSSLDSPLPFTSESTCADILACFEEAVALKHRQSMKFYPASVRSIPPGEYDVQFKIRAQNSTRDERTHQRQFVMQQSEHRQQDHPPPLSEPAGGASDTLAPIPPQQSTSEQDTVSPTQPSASLQPPQHDEGMNGSLPPSPSHVALPYNITFTHVEMPEPSAATRPRLPAQILAMFATHLRSLGTILSARPSGLYMMRFSPEIQAGLDSGLYTLNRNAYGVTVSVGDGKKIKDSGGLIPVSAAPSIVSAAVGALDCVLQLYYMAAIHSAIKQQTQAIERLNEHRLHAEFGKLMSVNQELTEVHEDLVAGRDVNLISSLLDAVGTKIKEALHALLCTLETFADRVRDVLKKYEESGRKLWITNFTALAHDFEGYRPSFDMLFEYVKCNIFVQCLKFAVAGSSALLEIAKQRVDAAVKIGCEMKERFAVCDDLIAGFAEFSWQPKNRFLKLAAAIYRGCHTLSGDLPKLQQASESIKQWKEETFSRHDAMMGRLLKKKVLVQWNANSESESERLQILG
eukprot:GILK01009668.1.p1 GENE.GILK01009668.1~~GILK01009668.1.p1  ORF type:complete len:531 (+),score=71.46 GILK01009668.1:705-2297(+)